MLKLFLIAGFAMDSHKLEPVDLTFIVDYITITMGVLAIVSVVVVGVQYLTAPNHSPKIRDSKRHLREIVIYFGIYALIYAILRWLLMLFSN